MRYGALSFIIAAQSISVHAMAPDIPTDLFDEARQLYLQIGTGEHFYVDGPEANQMGLIDVPTFYLDAICKNHTHQELAHYAATLTLRDLFILKRCYQNPPLPANEIFRGNVMDIALRGPRGFFMRLLMLNQLYWKQLVGLGLASMIIISFDDYISTTPPSQQSYSGFFKKTVQRLIPHDVARHKWFYASETLVIITLALKVMQYWLEPWLLGEPKAREPATYDSCYTAYQTWRKQNFDPEATPEFVQNLLDDDVDDVDLYS